MAQIDGRVAARPMVHIVTVISHQVLFRSRTGKNSTMAVLTAAAHTAALWRRTPGQTRAAARPCWTADARTLLPSTRRTQTPSPSCPHGATSAPRQMNRAKLIDQHKVIRADLSPQRPLRAATLSGVPDEDQVPPRKERLPALSSARSSMITVG
jgi:hypothetical protein